MKIGPIRLFEAAPEIKSESKIISPSYVADQPEVMFKKLIEYHDCTPQIQIGVTAYGELITGTELQINSDNERAKKIIEDFNEKVQLYDKLESMVNTLLITGNAILEKLDDNQIQDIVEVDMSSITGKKRDEFGNLKYYEQQLDAGGIQKLGENNINKFIEFNLSNYSRGAWGKSLFYALAKTRTVGNRTLRPLVEILWAAEDAMSAIMVNHAYPIVSITYEGLGKPEMEKEAVKWQKFKPGDKIIGTRKPDIQIWETNAQSKYTDYITHLEKTVELGIKFRKSVV